MFQITICTTYKSNIIILMILQRLKLIRKSLSLSAATIVALGLVVAHLDYANALYAGLPVIEIKKNSMHPEYDIKDYHWSRQLIVV